MKLFGLILKFITHDSPVSKEIFHWNFPNPIASNASSTVKVSVNKTHRSLHDQKQNRHKQMSAESQRIKKQSKHKLIALTSSLDDRSFF